MHICAKIGTLILKVKSIQVKRIHNITKQPPALTQMAVFYSLLISFYLIITEDLLQLMPYLLHFLRT